MSDYYDLKSQLGCKRVLLKLSEEDNFKFKFKYYNGLLINRFFTENHLSKGSLGDLEQTIKRYCKYIKIS